MKGHRRGALALTAVGILLTAACQAQPTGTTGGGGGEVTVGVIIKPPSFDYFARMERGIRDQIAALGVGLEFQAPSGFDAEEQVTRFEVLKAKPFDCLIANPMTGTNLVQALVGVDVPIVNIDNPIDLDAAADAGVTITSYVGSDNVEAGRIAGQHMAELLGGSGEVAAIAGDPTNQTSIDRITGFKEGATAGGLTVVQEVAANWDREQALTAAEDILRAHPNLAGFFAANDGMALGVQQAVENSGREVEVIGVDGDTEALESIRAGGLSATVAQYPYDAGKMAVEACVAAAQGSELPAKVNSPIQLITPEIVDQAIESQPEAFFDYEDPYAELLQG